MTREERLGGTRDEWIDTYKKAMCDCDETRGVGPSTVCEVAQIRVTIRKPKGCGERWASRWAGRHGKMDRGGGAQKGYKRAMEQSSALMYSGRAVQAWDFGTQDCPGMSFWPFLGAGVVLLDRRRDVEWRLIAK